VLFAAGWILEIAEGNRLLPDDCALLLYCSFSWIDPMYHSILERVRVSVPFFIYLRRFPLAEEKKGNSREMFEFHSIDRRPQEICI
jgi:hypothetical protein